ncbi:universal stress protein [Lacinutrix gracilariae]|uniref:Universal stress protein n=1 Tax=Lacinutrix gracilariae TaxID=1747198 RepID=A0ABW5K0I6_9FLAO
MVKILIPTDFSDNAMNAIKYALEFFKYQKAEIYFMHAYEAEVYNHEELLSRTDFSHIVERVKKQSEDNLESLLSKVKEISPNPNFQYHTVSAYNSLLDEADLLVDGKNIDLVVMGTKGKSNNSHLTFGSNTLQVLKYVQCPVLAIPENYQYQQPKHALFPTNYLIPYKRRELKLVCDLLTPYRTKIDMLYVSKTNSLSFRQEDNKTFIEETVCKNKLSFYTTNNKKIDSAINTYVEDNKVDFLIMVNTQHSYLENIIFQSTIDKISLKIAIPLLVLQNLRRQ